MAACGPPCPQHGRLRHATPQTWQGHAHGPVLQSLKLLSRGASKLKTALARLATPPTGRGRPAALSPFKCSPPSLPFRRVLAGPAGPPSRVSVSGGGPPFRAPGPGPPPGRVRCSVGLARGGAECTFFMGGPRPSTKARHAPNMAFILCLFQRSDVCRRTRPATPPSMAFVRPASRRTRQSDVCVGLIHSAPLKR